MHANNRVCIRTLLFLNIINPVSYHVQHTVSPKLTLVVIIIHLVMSMVLTVPATAYAIITMGH